MLHSKTMLVALGKSYFHNMQCVSAIHLNKDTKLREETYEELGKFYCARYENKPYNFSKSAYLDVIANSWVMAESIKEYRKKNPLMRLTDILKIFFTDALIGQSSSQDDLKIYVQSKVNQENPHIALKGFIVPYIILVGTYRYLPDTTEKKQFFCEHLKFIEDAIRPHGNQFNFSIFMTASQEFGQKNLEAILPVCIADLMKLDYIFNKWAETAYTSLKDCKTASHCMRCIVPSYAHKNTPKTVELKNQHHYQSSKKK